MRTHMGSTRGPSRSTRADACWSPRISRRVWCSVRIVSALIVIEHGTQKFFAFPAASASGSPALLSLSWWQGVIELVGGILLLLGLFTRPVAFILAGDMAFAYWMVHAPRNF